MLKPDRTLWDPSGYKAHPCPPFLICRRKASSVLDLLVFLRHRPREVLIRGVRAFQAWRLVPCAWACDQPFSAPKSSFSVWPHCVQGTHTWVWQQWGWKKRNTIRKFMFGKHDQEIYVWNSYSGSHIKGEPRGREIWRRLEGKQSLSSFKTKTLASWFRRRGGGVQKSLGQQGALEERGGVTGGASQWLDGAWTSLVSQLVKNPPAMSGFDPWVPGSGRPPGEGKGCPLQYPGRGNPLDRGAWPATIRGVRESDTTE